MAATGAVAGGTAEKALDEYSAIGIDIPLEYDIDSASQLGSTIYKNKTEADLSSPRSIITEKEIRNFRFQARYHTPTRFGTYRGQPACLAIIDFAFQKTGSTISRYTHAEIDVSFEDGKAALLDDLTDEEEAESQQYQPKILAFEPRLYHGPQISGTGTTTMGIQASIGTPGGVGSVTPGISRTAPFVKEGFDKVHGLLTDEDSRIHLSIDENALSNGGLRSEWSVAMIVGYIPKRRFAARVTMKAHVFLRVPNPLCGKKDDPIFFDDSVAPMGRSAGSTDGRQTVTRDATHEPQRQALDDVDLKAHTRLGVWGGSFL